MRHNGEVWKQCGREKHIQLEDRTRVEQAPTEIYWQQQHGVPVRITKEKYESELKFQQSLEAVCQN